MLATIATLLLAAPVPRDTMKPPEVRHVGTVKRKGVVLFQFEMINPNTADLHYTGYTSGSFEGGRVAGVIAPLHRLKFKTGADWKDFPKGWCKTGVGPVTIPAKGKGTFEVLVPKEEWDEARFGVTWFTGADRKTPNVAWVTVSRKDAEPKAPVKPE